jgi:tyrosyl-DNA phosphodiesterase 1
MADNPPKRRRVEEHDIQTLQRAISPPPSKRRRDFDDTSQQPPTKEEAASEQPAPKHVTLPTTPIADDGILRSPFRLTAISDLDPICNADVVTLSSLIGSPDLSEAWLFDYLFDVDFIMAALEPSIRDNVRLKIVHGSWQAESPQLAALDEAMLRHSNLEVVCAHMPERFGTHHSKMMVLFFGTGMARVVIHTANMIPKDWANMTQGAWLSPLLPPLDPGAADGVSAGAPPPIGSGLRFKVDLLHYLGQYNQGRARTVPLIAKLRGHDFSAVRAAFLASAPSSHFSDARLRHTQFGWPGLAQILLSLPGATDMGEVLSEELVVQVSSVATVWEKWLTHFQNVLSTNGRGGGGGAMAAMLSSGKTPRHRIVFPTEDEVRTSLDGYASGGSIHLKGASKMQQKQLDRLGPLWRRWSGGGDENPPNQTCGRGDAMRGLAAPHIKTFARLATVKQDNGMEAVRVRWALLTSANLSTQAWGTMQDANGKVKVCSYEVGVLVWPELFAEEGGGAVEMVPVFGRDSFRGGQGGEKKLVPLRLPYGLPLEEYRKGDRPWCKNVKHDEPDINGLKWESAE